jgi:predicted phage tail protein
MLLNEANIESCKAEDVLGAIVDELVREPIANAVQNIDLTQVANKVEEEADSIEAKIDESVNTLSTKIDNIKLPEIDTTELAKQGENQEATNSKIYDAVKSIPDLSLLYAARAEKNDDGVNTYSIVLPVTAKVTYDDNGVATIQL